MAKLTTSSRRQKYRTPDELWAMNLWSHYRLRPQDYYRMMRAQDSRCAVCGVHERDVPANISGRPRAGGQVTPARHNLVVDHCHRTGTVRALLCPDCNKGLGCFRENIAKLEGAVAYLRRLGVTPLPDPVGTAVVAAAEPVDDGRLW